MSLLNTRRIQLQETHGPLIFYDRPHVILYNMSWTLQGRVNFFIYWVGVGVLGWVGIKDGAWAKGSPDTGPGDCYVGMAWLALEMHMYNPSD